MDGIYDKVVSEINKRYSKKAGRNICHVYSDKIGLLSDVDFWLSTKCSPLDKIIGNGLPGKRVIEIFGPESCGKSTLLLEIIISAQEKGFIPILFEPESSYIKTRLEALGVKKNELIVIDAETIEEFFNVLYSTIKVIKKNKSDAKILVGWDSLASTLSKSILEADFENILVAPVARVMSERFKKITSFICKNDAIMIVINQTRFKIDRYGNKYIDPEDSPGGKALKFHSSVRLRMKTREKIRNNNKKVIGVVVDIQTVKNKVQSPFKNCMVVLDFEKGINNLDSIVYSFKRISPKGLKFEGKLYKGSQIKKLIKDNKEARICALKIIREGEIG